MSRMLRRAPLLVLTAAVVISCAATDSGEQGSSEGAVSRPTTQIQVKLTVANGEATARVLGDEGFDVVEGSITADALEVIGSADEIDRLRALGYAPVTIEIGKPFDPPFEVKTGTGYPSLDAMHDKMRAIEAAHPDIAKVVDITETLGTPPTVQGRHLFALKISTDVQHDADKPTFLLVANHHARELNTPVVAMRAMDYLVNGYASNDARITKVVQANEIWIAPTWNPDGLEHVHNADRMWRKNRRPNTATSFGVDQNRNYPFLWNTSCGNSTSTSSETYKGPSAGSEAETQTMMTFSRNRHFTKVIDFHSYGREVLANYACAQTPLATYFGALSKTLSTSLGYHGETRKPSGQGEHPDWQQATMSSLSFLVEIGQSFQPTIASAQTEAEQVLPGILWHLELPIPVSGHVHDAATGAPLSVDMTVKEVAYTNGERSSTGGPFGRFQAFLPPGTYTLEFAAPGYQTTSKSVTVTAEGGTQLDVALPKL